MRKITITALAVILLILSPAMEKVVFSQAQTNKPAAALIAEMALANARNSHNIKKQYSFRRREVKESLNENGTVSKTAVKTEIKLGKDFRMAGQNLDFYDILSNRFDFSWDESGSTAVVNGIECVVIHLTPKPDLRATKATDQVANRLNAALYIDLRSLAIQRITASTPSQFSFWYRLGGFIPLLVTISRFDIDMDLQKVDDLFWAENNARVTAKYSIAGISFYERYTYTHDQFKK